MAGKAALFGNDGPLVTHIGPYSRCLDEDIITKEKVDALVSKVSEQLALDAPGGPPHRTPPGLPVPGDASSPLQATSAAPFAARAEAGTRATLSASASGQGGGAEANVVAVSGPETEAGHNGAEAAATAASSAAVVVSTGQTGGTAADGGEPTVTEQSGAAGSGDKGEQEKGTTTTTRASEQEKGTKTRASSSTGKKRKRADSKKRKRKSKRRSTSSEDADKEKDDNGNGQGKGEEQAGVDRGNEEEDSVSAFDDQQENPEPLEVVDAGIESVLPFPVRSTRARFYLTREVHKSLMGEIIKVASRIMETETRGSSRTAPESLLHPPDDDKPAYNAQLYFTRAKQSL